MEYIVTAQEMRDYDRNTIVYYGVESLVLMERAAYSVCERIIARKDCKKILVLCGSGNNGGDGFAIARILHTKKYDVKVLFAGAYEKMTEETKIQYDIVKRYGILVEHGRESIDFLQEEYHCIVDCIFGISLSRPIEGIYAEIIKQANSMNGFKIAVDVPSGISTDTGMVLGCVFCADETVTFGFKKAGLYIGKGREVCGEIICADIGIGEESFLEKPPSGFSYKKEDLSLIPKRNWNSHKGSFGKVLLIAGSSDIGGACVLSALSLYRSGCGYVKVFTHEKNRDLIMGEVPEAVVSVYSDETLDLHSLKEACDFATVIVMGPGMGKSDHAKEIVKYVLSKTNTPLVMDADAINLVSENEELQELLQRRTGCQPIILTPHLLELKRLSGLEIEEYKSNILEKGLAIANKYHCVLVCKDSVTVVFDGRENATQKYYINQSGNDGLATAGSGDVLAGLVGSMLGKGMDAMDAACMGVYLHGVCAQQFTQTRARSYMKPTDIIEGLIQILE